MPRPSEQKDFKQAAGRREDREETGQARSWEAARQEAKNCESLQGRRTSLLYPKKSSTRCEALPRKLVHEQTLGFRLPGHLYRLDIPQQYLLVPIRIHFLVHLPDHAPGIHDERGPLPKFHAFPFRLP